MNSLNPEFFFYKIFVFLERLLSADSYQTIVAKVDYLKPYSTALSLLLLVGIFYSFLRVRHLEREMTEKITAKTIAAASAGVEAVGESNPRWQSVIEHVNSENESDWRLAILECDIVLSEALVKMGYHGETVSDMLKGVEKSDFPTLEAAWEAHKVRNAIAHEGANFVLSAREAKRVVALYESVFKDFKFI